MGRKRVYPDSAARQRHYQQQKKERELQSKIEAATKANVSQVVKTEENLESLINLWFYGKTIPQVKEAYQSWKKFYKVLGVDVDFMEIHLYLGEDLPLVHGITVGEIQGFLEVGDPKVECELCDYMRSSLEPTCPQCFIRIHEYKKYLDYRRTFE